MSEEGQNGQNKVDFDSADIGKKQKAVQFTEIEGAEERAKAAEKAKLAAEKAANELHEANVKAVAARQDAIKKQERYEKGSVLYKIFAGWRKWVILAVLLMAGAGIAVYLIFFNKPAEVSPREAAKALYDQQAAAVNFDDFEGTYPAARDAFEEAWFNASDNDKFWYGYYYATFLRDVGYSEEAAVDVLRQVKVPSDLDPEETCLIYDLWMKFRSYEDLNLIIDSEEFWSCE